MRSTRIVVIGDYNRALDRFVVRSLATEGELKAQVLARGVSKGKLKKENISNQVILAKGNDDIYKEFIKTAEVLIVLDPEIRFNRRKKNQKIIWIIDEPEQVKERKCSIADADFIILTNNFKDDKLKNILSCCDNLVDNIDTENVISCCLPIIKEHIKNAGRKWFVVAEDFDSSIEKNVIPVHHFLKRRVKDYNDEVYILAISYQREKIGKSYVEANFSLSDLENNDISLKDSSRFIDGNFIYSSELAEKTFKNFAKNNDLAVSPENEFYFSDLKYFMLNNYECEEKRELTHSEYKKLLKLNYDRYNCADKRVSIIICRYNTENELLFRAVESTFDAGHENIEVIVIDDGSKDNIEDILFNHFSDNKDKLKYYYKENEGLGLSRNYGINKSTGDYVYYLDSDDTMEKECLKLLLSHIVYFDLDLVVGKRLVCDEHGRIINESLSNLTGSTFTAYYNDAGSDSYNDVMVNNLLIRKEALFDKDVWFTRGLYEDIEYTSKLYSRVEEYHFCAINCHYWYQYGQNTSISSSVSFKNFNERLAKLKSAWDNIDENSKMKRMSSIINADFNRYYYAFDSFTDKEQIDILKGIKSFIDGKEDYIDTSTLNSRAKEVLINLNKGKLEAAKNCIYKWDAFSQSDEPHDNYIALTHYHILTSIAHAIENGRPARLFINEGYIQFSNQFKQRLVETGVFDEVKIIGPGNVIGKVYRELEERPEDTYSIIPTYLIRKYEKLFIECNREKDRVFIFSDIHPYWLFIERAFNTIIKIEDAYNSFDREVSVQRINGMWEVVTEKGAEFLPKRLYMSDKIKEIIVSKPCPDIPEFYQDKLHIIDSKELFNKHREKLCKISMELYDFDSSMFNENSVLVLTQPLHYVKYCTKYEQKELYREICSRYDKSKVVVKPHPADNMNYSYLGCTIMSREMPIEVLGLTGINIQKVVSFSSSANESITFAKDNEVLFPLHGFEYDDVVLEIRKIANITPKKRIKRKLSAMRKNSNLKK